MFHFSRLETERPPPAFVDYLAVLIDDEYPVGHAAVRVADSVIHFVNQQRHGHFQRAATFLSDGDTIGLVCRLENRDADFVISRLAPAVGRVRLADIDRQESDSVFVALMNLFQDPRLGSIGASGKAAEDEHHGLLAAELGERDGLLAVVGLEREIGRELADIRPLEEGAQLAVQQTTQ